jgi:hypothetical protein
VHESLLARLTKPLKLIKSLILRLLEELAKLLGGFARLSVANFMGRYCRK